MELNFAPSRFCKIVVSIFMLAAFALSAVSNSHAAMHGANGVKSVAVKLLSAGADCEHDQNHHANADHSDIDRHNAPEDHHGKTGDCCSASCVSAIMIDEVSKVELEAAGTEAYWHSPQVARSEMTELHRPPSV